MSIIREPIIVTPPEVEPVDLDTAKQYARVDNDSDDDLINMFITSARVWCEAYCNRAFITQTLGYVYDYNDDAVLNPNLLALPQPVQSIEHFLAYDISNEEIEFDSDSYYLASSRIIYGDDFAYPEDMRDYDAVRVDAVVGYGDDPENVPMPIREAILRLVAHIYQNREAYYDSVNGSWNGKNAPNSVTALLMPYRNIIL